MLTYINLAIALIFTLAGNPIVAIVAILSAGGCVWVDRGEAKFMEQHAARLRAGMNKLSSR